MAVYDTSSGAMYGHAMYESTCDVGALRSPISTVTLGRGSTRRGMIAKSSGISSGSGMRSCRLTAGVTARTLVSNQNLPTYHLQRVSYSTN